MTISTQNTPGGATPDILTERQEEVARLRGHGHTIREIGRELGVSHATINSDLKAVRKKWREEMAQSYEDHVANELARYDELAKHLRRGVELGDWKAIDTAIRLADRRARLLGVDMPVKTEVRITVEAIDEQIAKLEAKAGLPVIEGEVVEDGTPEQDPQG